MRTLDRWLWLVFAVLLAGAAALAMVFSRDRSKDVITFQYHYLSATMQSPPEVDPGTLAAGPGARPRASLPFEPLGAAALLAIAGLAIALQQRDRSSRS